MATTEPMQTPPVTQVRAPARRITPATKKQPRRKSETRGHATIRSPIIGIGASAGGLEALRSLFNQLNEVPRASFVVVQHMSPQHRSVLSQLLGKETTLTVKDIEDGEPVAPGRIYITPPNADVSLRGRRLMLSAPHSRVAPKPSIDHFFATLAEEEKERAVGIVLSGTGSDGAHGIRAIKAAGGVAIAQDPQNAKYDGMPRAAINTGVVDFVLPVDEIARELGKVVQDYIDNTDLPPSVVEKDPYRAILGLIKKRTKVDFLLYKQNTVQRRIKRRMDANKLTSLEKYRDLLLRNRDEVRALYQDILINVTAFFRDQEEFRVLREELKRRLAQKDPEEPFRAWVAGCATGEEAYSIAILLHELTTETTDRRIQVFATDIDEIAMSMGRRGSFPESAMTNVSAEAREKYFVRMDGHYQIKKFIRELVVFARHDLTQDPPFMKMDLISCRNVFIYFEADTQDRIFRIFHYALNPDGRLFLGKAESANGSKEYFEEVGDETPRLYGRTKHAPDHSIRFLKLEFDPSVRRELPKNSRRHAPDDLLPVVVKALAPHAVLTTETFAVRQIFGNAKKFLELPEGEMSQAIQKLVIPELRDTVNVLLHRAKSQGQVVKGRATELRTGGNKATWVRPSVHPLAFEGSLQFVVVFDQEDVAAEVPATKRSKRPKEAGSAAKERLLRELEQELGATREHLQTIIEAQETANEELQALNEELNSANEEMQSTNEELETANEELQSSNEELTTLNEELNAKSQELVELNEYMEHVQNAIEYPLITVDKNMHLRRYNVAAARFFAASDRDIGRNIRLLGGPRDLTKAYESLETAIRTGEQVALQMESDAHFFRIQADPVFTHRQDIDGAVLSVVDNSLIVNAMREAEAKERQLQALMENTPAVVSIKDVEGRYLFANQRFGEVYGRSPSEVLGKSDEELFGEAIARTHVERDIEVMKHRQAVTFQEAVELDGTVREFLFSKFPIHGMKGQAQRTCTIALDVTEMVSTQRSLAVFKQALASSHEAIAVFRHRGRKHEVLFVNGAFENLFGQRLSQAIGKSVHDLLLSVASAEAEQDLASLREEIVNDRVNQLEFKARRADGGEAWVDVRFSQLSSDDQMESFAFILILDVSARKAAEEAGRKQQDELLKAGKLLALGEMAAGIAHELNTPLNAIQANVDYLEQMVESGTLETKDLSESVQRIEETVQKIATIISGLKTIAKQGNDHEWGACSLTKVLKEAVELTEYHVRNNGVRLEIVLPEPELMIQGNGVQISQVMINLINNAVDAVKRLKEKWIRISAHDAREHHVIRVTDSGGGIPPQLAEKIMVPFFTTKKEGTGLGLSLSQAIIKRHGGSLSINQSIKDTCFEVSLPKPKA